MRREVKALIEAAESFRGASPAARDLAIPRYVAAANPAAILDLIAYVERLESALRPFADCADHFAKHGYRQDELVVNQTTWSSDGTTKALLSRADFASAASALSGGTE